MIPEQHLAIRTIYQGIQNLLPRYNSFILPAIRSETSLCVLRPLYIIPKSISNTDKVSRITLPEFMEGKIFEDVFTKLKSLNTPSVLPKPEDKVITLYNINNKTYTTKINENTKTSDITNEQMVEEVKKRALVNIDDGKTVIDIKLKDNSMSQLGASKFGIKLSVLGRAYMEQLQNKSSDRLIQPPIFDKNNQPKFIITMPPKTSESTLLETGKQKHLLVVVDNNGNYYAIGYFTSKNSGIFISDTQVKIFQDQMENNIVKDNKKKQYLVRFEKPQEIKPEDIMQIKWDQEYLENLSLFIRTYLRKRWEDLCKQPSSIIFDIDGISKEQCLEMCKEHDKIISTGKKHPISADQHRLNEENKQKQKANNQFKNPDKNQKSHDEKTN